MLDKIKVYRRSDAKEEKEFHLGFKINGIALDFHRGEVFTLTKTDPLKKFKNEMQGWWFCQEYVVINDNIDTLSATCMYGYHIISGYKGILGEIEDCNPTEYIKEGFGKNPINDIIDKPIRFHYDTRWIKYSSVGEDKYLKLLELIK